MTEKTRFDEWKNLTESLRSRRRTWLKFGRGRCSPASCGFRRSERGRKRDRECKAEIRSTHFDSEFENGVFQVRRQGRWMTFQTLNHSAGSERIVARLVFVFAGENLRERAMKKSSPSSVVLSAPIPLRSAPKAIRPFGIVTFDRFDSVRADIWR